MSFAVVDTVLSGHASTVDLATWLIKSTGNLAAPAWYIAAAALATTAVTFVATRPPSPPSPKR
jgi:hypothetical protein